MANTLTFSVAQNEQPLLYRKKSLANILGLSTSKLDELVSADASFPRPIKMGTHRQSSVFFDALEVRQWIDEQKAKRGEAA